VKINMIKINLRAATVPAGGVSLADHPKVRGFSWPFIGDVRSGSKGHAERARQCTMAAANVQTDQEC
jgi:hypothetical protein